MTGTHSDLRGLPHFVVHLKVIKAPSLRRSEQPAATTQSEPSHRVKENHQPFRWSDPAQR
ncbi:hypothetical protein HerbRD11066_58960 [Herbidospora sp. RD11066]